MSEHNCTTDGHQLDVFEVGPMAGVIHCERCDLVVDGEMVTLEDHKAALEEVAAAYQCGPVRITIERLEEKEPINPEFAASIRKGSEQIKEGRTQSFEAVFDEQLKEPGDNNE